MSETRFFHISYNFSNGSGDCTITTNGCFPNQKETIETIKPKLPSYHGTVSIVSIFEFKCAGDYYDWIQDSELNKISNP